VRIRFSVLVLSLGLLFAPSAHAAMNQWYQQGFNDGISYQDQVCRATIDQQVSLVQQENVKLRAELVRLQAILQGQQAQPQNQNQAYLTGTPPGSLAKSRYYDQVDD
jgi:hypothetical protein